VRERRAREFSTDFPRGFTSRRRESPFATLSISLARESHVRLCGELLSHVGIGSRSPTSRIRRGPITLKAPVRVSIFSSRPEVLGINASVPAYRRAMSKTAEELIPHGRTGGRLLIPHVLSRREIPGRRGALGNKRRLIRSKACTVRGDFRGSLART